MKKYYVTYFERDEVPIEIYSMDIEVPLEDEEKIDAEYFISRMHPPPYQHLGRYCQIISWSQY